MHKLLKTIMIIAALFSMAACKVSPQQDKDQANDNKVEVIFTTDEETLYLPVDAELSEDSFELEAGETIEIEGEYDVKKAGTYIIKIIRTDKAGNKTETDHVLIIDEKEKLEEIKAADEKDKETSKPTPTPSSTPDTTSDPSSEGTKVDGSEEDNKLTVTPESSVSSNQPEDNGDTNDGETTVTPVVTPTPAPTPTPTSKPQGSNNYNGLDMNDSRIKIAYSYEGQEGGCEYISAAYLSEAFGISQFKGYQVSEPALGDVIYYYDENNNFRHEAVYLGNGLALHGNYSNGKAKIASAWIYTSQDYWRYDANGNFPTLRGSEPANTPSTEENPSKSGLDWDGNPETYPYNNEFDYSSSTTDWAKEHGYTFEELIESCNSQDSIYFWACQAVSGY